jgi:hypothetical protein
VMMTFPVRKTVTANLTSASAVTKRIFTKGYSVMRYQKQFLFFAVGETGDVKKKPCVSGS